MAYDRTEAFEWWKCPDVWSEDRNVELLERPWGVVVAENAGEAAILIGMDNGSRLKPLDRIALRGMASRKVFYAVIFVAEQYREPLRFVGDLHRILPDDQKCACGAKTPEGKHEKTAYCTSEWSR